MYYLFDLVPNLKAENTEINEVNQVAEIIKGII